MRVVWTVAIVLSGAAGAFAAEHLPSAIVVSSPAVKDKQPLAAEYSCEGRGAMVPIEWGAVPPDTKSVAVLIDDPDAPRGTFVHWLAYNLPPSTHRAPLTGDARRAAALGVNGIGAADYTPPCPPAGRHHYRFKVFALDTTLELTRPTAADFERAIAGHVVAQGELVATYQKQQP